MGDSRSDQGESTDESPHENPQTDRIADEHEKHLLRAIELSRMARGHGNTPFGSLLVDAGGAVRLEQENVEITERDCTGHAETALIRAAGKRIDRGTLAGCTLYTSCEPCAMCATAIYWGNVGRVAFAMSAADLGEVIGAARVDPPLTLGIREVFSRTEKRIVVIGPVEAVRRAAIEAHAGFWSG